MRITFYGNVQGVGFRSLIKKVAHENGIKGIVWNDEEDERKVIAVFQHDNPETILTAVSNILFHNNRVWGPYVENTEMKEEKNCKFTDFKIVLEGTHS